MSDDSPAISAGGLFTKKSFDPRILKRSGLYVEPKIIFVNKFNEDSARKFAQDISEAEETGQPIIPIYIDSYGGHVDAVVNMVDVMRSCKTPIATICLGKAMSCGVVLLTQGTEGHRFMSPSSRVMIHEVASGTFGKVEEMKADATEVNRLNKMIFKWMSNGTQHSDDYFGNIVHEKSHADWYLTADDCKYHNIVNHVRIPKFNISVKMDINFE